SRHQQKVERKFNHKEHQIDHATLLLQSYHLLYARNENDLTDFKSMEQNFYTYLHNNYKSFSPEYARDEIKLHIEDLSKQKDKLKKELDDLGVKRKLTREKINKKKIELDKVQNKQSRYNKNKHPKNERREKNKAE